jgi:hypothetical protein
VHHPEAPARPQQRIVQIANVRKVRRKDDLSSLRAHYPVCDSEKSVQVLIPVAAGHEHVIRVLDHERIVRPGNEVNEISSFSSARLSAVYITSALSCFRRDIAPRMDRTRRVLPVPGGTLEDQYRLVRPQVSLDELANGLTELRVCLTQRDILCDLFKRTVHERAM